MHVEHIHTYKYEDISVQIDRSLELRDVYVTRMTIVIVALLLQH